jgi:hypothetical protein
MVRAYSGQTQTGTDLFLLRLGPKGEKVWEAQVHKGAVAYGGDRYLADSGKFLLAFNGEVGPEKWYTRVVLVDPATGSTQELAKAEIKSKGTGLPPRLALLDGGLALGNADGFGWFAPKDEREERAGESGPEGTKEATKP